MRKLLALLLILAAIPCLEPKHAQAFTPFDVGFDFRSTLGFVTDPVYAQGIVGSEIYPTTTTINGQSVTYGWDTNLTGNSRDGDNTVDARIAGIEFNGGTTATFRVDLPATGTYNIGLAIGDAARGNAQTNYITVLDNTTAFITFAPISTDSTHFADAAGNFWTKAAWPGSNVTVSQTFTSTILKLQCLNTGGNNSVIAHLRITQAGGGGGGGAAVGGAAKLGGTGKVGMR